jgi:hypothetical protein
MKSAWIFLTLTLGAAPALAQESCESDYKLLVKSCVTAQSPTEVRTVTTDWILVNKGARRVSNDLCTAHVAVIAQANPQASNILVAQIKDEDATQRGIGKRDVSCKFSMSAPVQVPVPDESCGITGVERTACAFAPNMVSVQNCIQTPAVARGQYWIKAACLMDSYKAALQISGMTSDIYNQVKFQLDVMKDQGEPALRAMIRSQMVK